MKEAATKHQISELEEKIGIDLPQQLKTFFLDFSQECEVNVFLPDNLSLPKELQEIFSACLLISLEEIENAENSRKGWVDACFTNEEDEYDKVWHHKLGLMTVGNGDVIALDIESNPTNPSVIYLSHDDGEGHGYILGKDFNSYLQSLLDIGLCGNEDWQVIPFIQDSQSGINAYCENANTYRKIIGFNLLSNNK
ncbi:MAG: SMI1/KNR4 family protein [Bacilli bacterium]